MKVLVIHPGHSLSTSDVYDGVCAGLRANGVEVVPFDWQRMMEVFTTLVVGAAAAGKIPKSRMEELHKFCTFVASADATNTAITESVDAVIVVNGLLFPPSRIAPLQMLGIPVACVGTESPYFDDTEQQIAPFYTHWFTNERSAVARFQSNGVRCTYLPMAWNPERHTPAAPDPDKASDVVFIGGGFPERRRLLFGERAKPRSRRIVGGVNWTGIDAQILGTLWHLNIAREAGSTDFLRGQRYAAGSIPNSDTRLYHASAKIALNLHRQMTYVERNSPLPPGAAESLGPRAYEIPAVGGFMLCDDERPEIFDVLGDAAATFTAWESASLEREIRYWLSHPDAREERQRAQHQAIQAHSWTHRAAVLLETITP